ncbi:MAG: sugar phosphate isomerase/epimerase, partial [Clostridia bacterium]|nr:sugar phosphate isomerase/epimerase [Clostridia bacterium]
MKQNYELKTEKIREQFLAYKKANPELLKNHLKFSWSNWGFGLESFETSCERLNRAGISYIELHGNHYGADLGYKPAEVLKIMDAYGIKTGGVCGMFSADNDLSSNRHIQRQAAIDYIKRESEFTAAVG